MEDQRSSTPSSVTSSNSDEIDSKIHPPIFNPYWFSSASAFHSIRPTTPKVRHNFKSIDELLSLTPSQKADDTGYNSQIEESSDNIENSKPIIKKSKKTRTVITDDQKQYLEHFYSTNRYPDPTELEQLSYTLSLNEKVIRVWFQNKRSREKLRFC